MTAENVIIRFVGEDNVSNVTSTIDKNMGALGGQAEAVATKMSAFQGVAQGAFMAIGGALTNLAGAGLQQLGSFFTGAIAESSSWQSALAQTEAVVKSTGGAAGITATEMGKMAEALSAASGKSIFSDDAILGAQNVLATFTQIKGTNFGDATSAILDVSQALGQDLQSTSIQVGKALNDPVAGISALSRVGVTFSEEQKAVIASLVETGDVAGAQQVIIAELNKEFGGSAAAAADTYAGRQAALAAQFENIQQKLGESLLPVLEKFGTFMSTTIVPIIDNTVTALSNWITSMNETGTTSAIFTTIQNAIAGIPGVLAQLGAGFAQVQIFLQPLTTAVTDFVAVFVPAMVQAGLAIAEYLGSPTVQKFITLLGLLFAQLATTVRDVLIFAFQNLTVIWGLLVDAFKFLSPYIKIVFDQLIANATIAINFVSGLLSAFSLLLKGDIYGALMTLNETFQEVWYNIKIAVQTGVDYITTAIKTKIDEAKQLGTDLVKGIANGIDLGVSFVKEAIERVLGAALQKARDWGLIESPSRKFADMVGAPISQGMAQGIINSSGLVADASSMAVGNAAAVTTYNYNLNASYATVQNEGNIMQDLRAMQLMSGAV